jgi:hypothetical protein
LVVPRLEATVKVFAKAREIVGGIPPMAQDLIAIAEKWCTAAVAGDDTAYDSDRYFAEDLKVYYYIEGVPQSGVFYGPEGVRRCMGIMNATWKKTWTFKYFQYGDDLLIVYEDIIWANHDTCKTARVPAIGVYKYRDGLICRIDVYVTDEDALRDTLVP